jgi:hypothetical protein
MKGKPYNLVSADINRSPDPPAKRDAQRKEVTSQTQQ